VSTENSKKVGMKQKAAHELQEFAGISLYLAFFFCSIAAYSALLMNQFHISYFNYGTAMINALVIAKVILIGEYAHLGQKQERKPLFQSALYKALLFGFLVLGFHIIEEVIKVLWHGEILVSSFHKIRVEELLARTLIVFCTFIPLFAFRELGRVMGEEKFRDLFFRTGAVVETGVSRKV
jgi:hypothetical protein